MSARHRKVLASDWFEMHLYLWCGFVGIVDVATGWSGWSHEGVEVLFE